MTHGVEEGVDAVVLEQAGGFSRFDPLCGEIFFMVDAQGVEDVDGVLALSGSIASGAERIRIGHPCR
jgi:hypothetical protein